MQDDPLAAGLIPALAAFFPAREQLRLMSTSPLPVGLTLWFGAQGLFTNDN